MLKQEQIVEIKESDTKKLGRVDNITEEIVGIRSDEIRNRAKAIRDKLQKKIDKKAEVLSLPYSNAETLELAVDALKEHRKKWFLEELLVPHLKNCKLGVSTFLDPNTSKAHLATERHLWKLLYRIITEDDIKAAIEMLPDDVGISSSERNKQIKKFDAEIAELESQAEELKKI